MKTLERRNAVPVRRWGRLGVALICCLGVALPGSNVTPVCAQIIIGQQEEDEEDSFLEKLLYSDLSDEEFLAELNKAKEAGFSNLWLLEVRLIRALGNENNTDLAALLPEAGPLLKNLDPDDSLLFDTREEASGMLLGLQAIEANLRGDGIGFERLIKEAFWAAPVWADTFGEWVAAFKKELRLAQLVVPLDTRLTTFDGKATTLREHLGNNKAILIDFWGESCTSCILAMPELKERAEKLAPQGVKVIGLNIEDDVAVAKRVRQKMRIDLPWLVEPEDQPYSKLLEVEPVPSMALLSPEGKVLFSGHPDNPRLHTALEKLGATL